MVETFVENKILEDTSNLKKIYHRYFRENTLCFENIKNSSNYVKMIIEDLQMRVQDITIESDNQNSRLLFVNTKNIINIY